MYGIDSLFHNLRDSIICNASTQCVSYTLCSGTEVMNCKMDGDEQATTYYLNFASETLSNMEDPGINIPKQVSIK